VSNTPLGSTELYDPASNSWSSSTLVTARQGGSVTLLANGAVLAAGGYNGSYLSSAELYGQASYTSPPNLTPISSIGFASPVEITLPYKARSIAAGDFNQDGKTDLVVANYDQNTVTVYQGNGDGTFTSVQEIGVGAQPTSVAFGTLNGNDSYLDIVTANSGSGSVSFQLGSVGSVFSSAGSYTTGAGTTSVVVGHFRNVGPPDLAVLNTTTGYLNIYYGQGQGAFTAGPGYYIGTGAVSVAKGDFNGDGKEDLAMVNYATGKLTVLYGDGTGLFYSNTGSFYDTPQYASSVATGDINGDGKLDLVVVSDGGGITGAKSLVSIFLGNGYGSFSQSALFEQPQFTSGAAIADFNGDGKADLILSNSSTNTLSLLQQGFQFGSPILVNSSAPMYYLTVQAALTSAQNGDVLETIAGDLYENLTLSRNVQLTLKGGVGTSNGEVTGYTFLHGTLTINVGTLVVENLTIV